MKTMRLLVLLLAVAGASAFAQQPPLNKALNERIVFVRHGFGVELETTIFKPDGDGPFPLAVVNHGKEFGDARFQPRARYIVAARELSACRPNCCRSKRVRTRSLHGWPTRAGSPT